MLGTGVALYDLANDLGFTFGPDGALATIGGTYSLNYCNFSGGYSGGVFTGSSVAQVAQQCRARAQAWISHEFPVYVGCTVSIVPRGNPATDFGLHYEGGGCSGEPTYTTSVTGGTGAPATSQDLADAIEYKMDWEVSSAPLARAYRDAIASGEVSPAEVTQITGPATSPGPSSEKIDTGTGNKTTTTTTYNYNYNGDTITTTTNTTTNVTNNAGDLIESSTETAEPEQQEEEKPDIPEGEVPKKTIDLVFSPENLGFGGGQCPAPFHFQTSTGAYDIDLAGYCSAMTTWVRPVVLAMAALAAFMIAWPRGDS